MSQSDKLEDCKKEIRSILIPFQRGCMISEFNRAYKELIGRRLPFREFGKKTDIEFLSSMPDVVTITPTRTGECHLFAVPDEKSKHIIKMVAKQKPSKSKVPPRIFRPVRSNYVLPPRFESTSRQSQPSRYESVGRRSQPPPSRGVWYSAPSPCVIEEPPKQEPPKPKINKVQELPKLPAQASPKDEVIALVQYFDNKIALDDLLFEYKRMYQKDLLLSKYGFSSILECVEDIPELSVQKIKNCDVVVFDPEFSDAVDSYVDCNGQDNSVPSSHSVQYSVQQSPKAPSTLNAQYTSNQNKDSLIPDSMTAKLQRVAENYPLGIWSSGFPSCYEKATGAVLDIHSLGYRCLNDLIDDVPDIFIRKSVAGSRKDYLIYPSKGSRPEITSTSVGSSYMTSPKADVLYVADNVRIILEACSEGIQINEFLEVYGYNFKDTLHIEDFGFDDLEAFLESIKEHVPLRIDSSRGVKTIYLIHSESPVFIKPPEIPSDEAIPSDAVHPDFKFQPQSLPVDYDDSKFIPVYVSSVAHPGHLYIQLQGNETTDAYVKLADEFETFYNGKKSAQYAMKNSHIKVGSSCMAKWLSDEHWYRAEVIAVKSVESVLVHYVDYGTRDAVPKSLLRYVKKTFSYLPAQALRCRLAYLKPPNNATKWNPESRNKILQLCQDIPLMAKLEIGADGIYSVLLCDTNGDEDVFINDVLCNEGFADYAVGSDSIEPHLESKTSEPSAYNYNLAPMQAWQARCFLLAFVTAAPCFAQNENYINLMRQVSMYCPNSDEGQNIGLPQGLAPSLGPPGFNSLPPNIQPFGNSNVLSSSFYNSSLTSSANVGAKFTPSSRSATDLLINFDTTSAPHDLFSSSVGSEAITVPKSLASAEENDDDDEESEIFYEDDEGEMFQQFCRKVTTNIRHVKRVLLGDGYKIHIIVVESKPYASSGDVSQLIWNNKAPEYLFQRLQVKDVDIPSRNLTAGDNEDLFDQLEMFNVRGIQKMTGLKDSILLYPLKAVIKILNIFGHPSVTLRTKLTEELANFNPLDPEWMNFSPPEPLEQEEEENSSGITDDDKIEKLCLFDLLAMKESITIRRKRLMNTAVNNVKGDGKNDEIEKLQQMLQKVLQRIQEIREICSVFA